MKARIKATGEIVEVRPYAKNLYLELSDNSSRLFRYDEVDNPNDLESYDYWTKLEHQYAGMAMQGLLQSPHLNIMQEEPLVGMASSIAHALVEKYKKEERK